MSRALFAGLMIVIAGCEGPPSVRGHFTRPVPISAEDSAITISGARIAGARLQYFRVEAAGTTSIDIVRYQGAMGNGAVEYLAMPRAHGGAFMMLEPDAVIDGIARQMEEEAKAKIVPGDTAEVEAGHARYPLRYFQLTSQHRAPQDCFAFGVGLGLAAAQFRGNTEQIYGYHCQPVGTPLSADILPDYFQGIRVHALARR